MGVWRPVRACFRRRPPSLSDHARRAADFAAVRCGLRELVKLPQQGITRPILVTVGDGDLRAEVAAVAMKNVVGPRRVGEAAAESQLRQQTLPQELLQDCQGPEVGVRAADRAGAQRQGDLVALHRAMYRDIMGAFGVVGRRIGGRRPRRQIAEVTFGQLGDLVAGAV